MFINWEKILKISQPIFYVTNDVAKGIGVENLLPNYHIICLDDHPLVDYLLKAGVKVFCLEKTLKQQNIIFRSTSKIIDHPLVLDYIKAESKGKIPHILFFKPSTKIDFVCKKFGFKKIGNSARINREFEDKVIFYEKCQEQKLPIPEGETAQMKALEFDQLTKRYGVPFVVQFGRGWAGNTTFFVDSKDHFSLLKRRFLQKKIKITRFIFGKTILNNACIFNKKIFFSPPAEQIRVVEEFTALPAATCGRQWPANLSKKQVNQVNQLTEKVGRIMQKFGYKGYFGLDFIVEEKTDKVFLSENNARLTASVPFFTKLEIQTGIIPLFFYHLSAFMGSDFRGFSYVQKTFVGSEVVARNDKDFPVKVKGGLMPGIYRFRNGKFNFLRSEYFAKDLKANEFWLTAAGKGRIVSPEQELVRINLEKKVLDKFGKIDRWIVDMIFLAKKSLKLENVKT